MSSGDLKRVADLASVASERLGLLDEVRDGRAPRDQRGSLAIDDHVVALAIEIAAPGDVQLRDLAFGHARDRVCHGLDRPRLVEVRDGLQRTGVAVVAGQHGEAVAVAQACSWPSTPEFTLIDDVVVQQRRGVQELGRGRDRDALGRRVAGRLRGEQGRHRAKALAPGEGQVAADARDDRKARVQQLAESKLDLREIVGDQSHRRRDGCELHVRCAGGAEIRVPASLRLPCGAHPSGADHASIRS